MATKFIAIALLFFSANVFAYTDCSDATGENRVEEANFRGGPAPMPTTVVDDIKIYMNNTLVSESKTLNNGTKTSGPLVASFDQSSKKSLNSLNDGLIQDYAIQVSVAPANHSRFPGGGPTPPTYLVICHLDNTPIP